MAERGGEITTFAANFVRENNTAYSAEEITKPQLRQLLA